MSRICVLAVLGSLLVCAAAASPPTLQVTVSCHTSPDCPAGSRLESFPNPFPWVPAPAAAAGGAPCDALVDGAAGPYGLCFPPPSPATGAADGDFLQQEMDGFGGSFLRSGAILLNMLSPARQDELLTLLFDPVDGSGFSIGKVPIAATDFMPPVYCEACNVSSWYSYEETPGNFSVAHDTEPAGGTIPYILRAQQYTRGTPILLESCMDFPPTWMLNTSTPLVPTPNPNDIPQTRVNHSHFADLASYFLRFTQAFKSHGVDITFLSMFNEPAQSYCNVDRDDLYTLLTEHVGPLFRATPGAPQITWGEQYGRLITEQLYPDLMQRPGVKNYTDILFYHGYDCGSGNQSGWECTQTPLGNNCTCPGLEQAMAAIASYKQQFPEYKMWLTELCYATEYGDYPPPGNGCLPLPRLDFMDGMQWGRMVFGDIAAGASGWIYWNILLDAIGGPYLLSPEHNDPVGNNQQPLIVVDVHNDTFAPTAVFYVMSHFSKFLARGARRIVHNRTSATPSNLYALTFVANTTDGGQTYTAVVMNDRQDAANVTVWFANHSTVVALPPVSVATLSFAVSGHAAAPSDKPAIGVIVGVAAGGFVVLVAAVLLIKKVWRSDDSTSYRAIN